MNKLNFLAKDALLYGFANAFSKLISIITFPLLTRYFSVEAYGKIDILFVFANLFVILFVFGQDSAVARFYYEYDKEPNRQNQVVSLSLMIQLIFCSVLIPVLWWNTDYLILNITGEIADKNLIYIILSVIPFGILINFSSNILKWTFDGKKFLVVTLGNSILYLSMVAIAVLFFNPDIIDIFYLYLISRVIFSIIGLSFVKKFIVKIKDVHLVKPLMNYATPYGLICVIAAAIPSLDRYFISNQLGSYQLGIYAVGYKLSGLISYPITAFQTAWGPFYLTMFKEEKIDKTFNDVLVIFSSVIFLIVLIILLLSDFLIMVLASSKYLEALPIILPILLGIAITSIKDIVSIGIDLSLKTRYRLYGTLIQIIFLLLFIYLLIKPMGIVGVAYALFLSSIAHFIYEFSISKKLNSLHFQLRNTFILFCSVTILGFLIHFIETDNLYYIITYRTLILSIFILLIYKIIPKHILLSVVSKLRLKFINK